MDYITALPLTSLQDHFQITCARQALQSTPNTLMSNSQQCKPVTTVVRSFSSLPGCHPATHVIMSGRHSESVSQPLLPYCTNFVGYISIRDRRRAEVSQKERLLIVLAVLHQ